MLPLPEIGRRIRTLREELDISRADLATACGVSEDVIEQLEAGRLEQVPGDYILIAARLLKVDFRWFISEDLDAIEQGTRRIFRALSPDTAPRDRVAIRRFVGFCLNESELEELLGIHRISLPVVYPLPESRRQLYKEQGPVAARAERVRLNLGLKPIVNVFSIIRSQGLRLSRQKLDSKEVSGLTVFHPRAGTAILVNYEEDLYRQFFSAAHEYAHALFDGRELEKKGVLISYKFSVRELAEIRANTFAAEFLLPGEALTQYSRPRDPSSLAAIIDHIARDYRVNTETVAIRAKEVGWISDEMLQLFRKNKPIVIPRADKHDPELSDNLTPLQAERWEALIAQGVSSYYVELCRRALTSDLITFGRFAELLDLTPEEASEFIQMAGLAV